MNMYIVYLAGVFFDSAIINTAFCVEGRTFDVKLRRKFCEDPNDEDW